MGKRAVIYTRVSTDEQGKGYSLDTQLEACREYAEKKDYTIVGEFSDMHTGTELDRPGLNDLIQFIENTRVERLVTHNIDRLSRKVGIQGILEYQMELKGIKTKYVIGFNDDSADGELMGIIKSGIAQYENRLRVERSRRGKIGRVKAGYVLCPGGRAPLVMITNLNLARVGLLLMIVRLK